MAKIKVLVADDHAIVRTGMLSLLARATDIEVVGEACDGAQAVSRAVKTHPDVIVMDLVMPKKNGIEATREIHEKLPDARILILTSFGTSQEVSSAFAAGASGAVNKNIPNTELIASIRRIAGGERVVSSAIQNMLDNNPPVRELSQRQREILESIARGLTNNQIALQFDISLESVKTHIARLFEKIGAANRSEAVNIALRMHLIRE